MLENKDTFLTTRVFSPRATHIKASLFPFVRLILFSSLFQHHHRHWHSNTNNHKKKLLPPSLQTKRNPIIIMRLQLSYLIVAALARLALSLPGSEISDITLRSLPCCQVNNQACDEPSNKPVSTYLPDLHYLTYTTWPTYLTTLPVYLLSAKKKKKETSLNNKKVTNYNLGVP